MAGAGASPRRQKAFLALTIVRADKAAPAVRLVA